MWPLETVVLVLVVSYVNDLVVALSKGAVGGELGDPRGLGTGKVGGVCEVARMRLVPIPEGGNPVRGCGQEV